MKVVGAGMNKTGTKTLGACLRFWGLSNVSWSHAAFELWRAGAVGELLDILERHDSCEDWPWPLVFREIDARFPGSKFVLTRRSSAAVWFDSLCRHADRTGPTEFRRAIYGHAMPRGHEADHVRVYEAHNAAVRAHFASRPGSLLEICWEEGQGWPELAAFLGRPCPDLPLPHENAGQDQPVQTAAR